MPFATPHPAIRRLLAGIKSFRARYYEKYPTSMRDLVRNGQKPEVLLIGCSDSRVDPAILTQAEPGELFIVRNVGNLVPPYQPDDHYHGTSAAIEYAVLNLGVQHAVVLGHADCGGIRSLIDLYADRPAPSEFVGSWVSIARTACDRFLSDIGDDGCAHTAQAATQLLQECPHRIERASVRGSVENLLSFPFVRERVETGRLYLHGWWFDLENGELWVIDPVTKAFVTIGD